MVIIRKTTRVGEGVDGQKPSGAAGGGGEHKMVQPPWKSTRQLLKRFNSDHGTRFRSWAHTRERKTYVYTTHVHTGVHGSIHESRRAERIQKSVR